MYLGRDKDYNPIYKKEREYFDNLGWNDKWAEVNQILSKVPLNEYLKNGLKILKIKY